MSFQATQSTSVECLVNGSAPIRFCVIRYISTTHSKHACCPPHPNPLYAGQPSDRKRIRARFYKPRHAWNRRARMELSIVPSTSDFVEADISPTCTEYPRSRFTCKGALKTIRVQPTLIAWEKTCALTDFE